jgi:hypothetical protein
VATSLNLFDPPGSPPAGERVANPSAARPADAARNVADSARARPPEAKPAEPGPAEPGPAEARSAARAPAAARSDAAPLDRFAVLLGRAPTDAEKLELVRVKEALDLDNNDALWLLIMDLDHLRERFEQSIAGQRRAFETAIEGQRRAFGQAVDRRLAETRQATDALVESAKTQFLRDFPAALKQAARRVSIKALGFNGPVVLSGPVAGVALALAGLGAVGAGWLAYELGERSGYERGMRAAQAEVALAPKPPAPATKR